MGYLALVHDSREGTLATGYWTCSVIGAEKGESAFTPLYNRLYSQAEPDFRSENVEFARPYLSPRNIQRRGASRCWIGVGMGERLSITYWTIN
jgi:hypothetical protein